MTIRTFFRSALLILGAAFFLVLAIACSPHLAHAADGRDYAAIAAGYGLESDVAGGTLLVGRVKGDLRGELGMGFNGDRAASLSIGGGYRFLKLPDKAGLWLTAATGYAVPSAGGGAPFAAAGLSFGVPIGERYGLSVGYSYRQNWETGTGGPSVGLRFTMFLNGP